MSESANSDNYGSMVERAAYERFAARGYEHGHDMDDWLAAEADVRRRLYLQRLGEARRYAEIEKEGLASRVRALAAAGSPNLGAVARSLAAATVAASEAASRLTHARGQ